ncbi:MAG TPA: UDP-N-acetylmuramoyl-L-alanine--D-glutamate ligase [Trebonia sp.]|nr:UDP-N-acetylmuramoyl-L-alanine--D-glutamate ligase [Trebonia sp.]
MTRPKLGWSDLRGATVGVWGLGREGQATVRRLRTLGIAPVLVDDSPNDSGVLRTADGGLDALKRCEVVIKTPGISPYGAAAAELRAAGVTLAGGLGLWMNEADLARVVYVTGTKGKSTTSSVIGHLLRRLGYQALVGGNFGVAPYDPEQAGDYDYWVIEVSSYTATDVAVTPPVAAVTSLHPDHLPWHGDVERYYADKLSATSRPGADLTVANGDSELLRRRAGLLGPRIEWVSDTDDPDATWMDHLGLPGRHNRRNALIARAVLRALGAAAGDANLVRAAAAEEELAAAAAGFTPLPSRLTPVAAACGVTFIDDSLSTNVLPTLAALDSFPGQRVALIVGGQDRGIDYGPLAEGVRGRQAPTLVLTLPDSGPRISRAFQETAATADRVPPAPADRESSAGRSSWTAAGGFAGVTDCPDLESAVAAGYQWAKPDGIVLLSPAAPSFGHFRDYRDRGDQFAAAARALSG